MLELPDPVPGTWAVTRGNSGQTMARTVATRQIVEPCAVLPRITRQISRAYRRRPQRRVTRGNARPGFARMQCPKRDGLLPRLTRRTDTRTAAHERVIPVRRN